MQQCSRRKQRRWQRAVGSDAGKGNGEKKALARTLFDTHTHARTHSSSSNNNNAHARTHLKLRSVITIYCWAFRALRGKRARAARESALSKARERERTREQASQLLISVWEFYFAYVCCVCGLRACERARKCRLVSVTTTTICTFHSIFDFFACTCKSQTLCVCVCKPLNLCLCVSVTFVVAALLMYVCVFICVSVFLACFIYLFLVAFSLLFWFEFFFLVFCSFVFVSRSTDACIAFFRRLLDSKVRWWLTDEFRVPILLVETRERS